MSYKFYETSAKSGENVTEVRFLLLVVVYRYLFV